MASEARFQKKIIDWAKGEGYHAMKIPADVEIGVPDLELFRGNRHIRIEVKSETGNIRETQLGWADRHPDELVLYIRPSEFNDYKNIIRSILDYYPDEERTKQWLKNQ